jgi:multidrug transporter EmrE-like cation transporter
MNAIFLGLVGAAVGLEIVADILFKKWALGGKSLILALGLALYFAGTVLWAYSLKYEYLSKAITVFTVLNLAFVALAGVVFFNEQLSFVNKLGILLGLVSVALLQL